MRRMEDELVKVSSVVLSWAIKNNKGNANANA
jgi:hypothetical protein